MNVNRSTVRKRKPKKSSLDTYKKDKIRFLSKEFNIELDLDQIVHMQSLRSEIAVDNFAKTLILRKYDD